MDTLSNAQTIINDTSTRGDKIMEFVITYGPKIIVAILLFVIGRWLIGYIQRLIDKSFQKAKLDISLRKFLQSLISIILKIALVISVASFLGFQSTSLLAILGAAGLAVGLALQGSLSNLASGIMILTFKPYKFGDFIDIGGNKGTVTNINIFNTEMISPEHKTIIIPNSSITSGTILNHNKIGNIRVDVTVGISYDADISKAKKVLQTIVEANTHALDTPAPGVFVSELADSSVNLIVRGFCVPSDYWNLYFSLTEQVKLTLDKEGIEIPFPQRVVHMTK